MAAYSVYSTLITPNVHPPSHMSACVAALAFSVVLLSPLLLQLYFFEVFF